MSFGTIGRPKTLAAIRGPLLSVRSTAADPIVADSASSPSVGCHTCGVCRCDSHGCKRRSRGTRHTAEGGWATRGRLALLAAMAVFALLPGGRAWGQSGVPKEIHLPVVKGAGFPTSLTDGGGSVWDVQYFLNIGSGNGIFSGAMFLRLNGQNVNSNGQGWLGEAPDEIEIGPVNFQSVQIFRRLKVYRDLPFARWLEIVVNPTSSPQTVPLECNSNFASTVTSTTGPTGANFAAGDWAMLTELEEGRAALQILATPKASLAPQIRAQQSPQQSSLIYTVTVPPNSAAIVCYFASQGDARVLKERLKNVPFAKLLADLPDPVRRLIVNMSVVGPGLSLQRRDNADLILLKNGDAMYGQILNKKFPIKALFGEMDLPDSQVVGFASASGQEGSVRALLVGGQVISGKLSDDAIHFGLPTGGELAVPFGRVAECSYRISKDKPESGGPNQPLILLRTGDRLAFDPAQLKCVLLSRHGRIELSSADLAEIRLVGEDQRTPQVQFANGSSLSGLLEGESISLDLKLGKKLDVPRDMVQAIQFNQSDKPTEAALTRAELDNGDLLFGRLADAEYTVQTEFGAIKVKPENILSIQFERDDPSRVTMRLWDGTTLRGLLKQDALSFAILPGPTVKLYAGQVRSVQSSQSLPPEAVLKKVEKLVAQLAGPQYEERQQAQDELIRLGPGIVPLLKRYVDDADPDIRQRITLILELLQRSPAGTDARPALSPGRS